MAAPGLWLAAALAAGMGAAQWLNAGLVATVPALGAAMVALAWASRRQSGRVLAACSVCAAAGGVRQAVQLPPPSSPQLAASELRGATWPRRVRLVGPVSRTHDDLGAGYRVLGQITHRRDGGLWTPERARAWLRLRPGRDGAGPRRGDLIEVRLRLRPWAPALAGMAGGGPGAGARRLEVSHVAVPGSDWALISPGRGFLAGLDGARQRAAAVLWAQLPAAHAALAQAMALGDPGGLEPALRERWAAAGMAHLLCVSGLHVGLVAGVLWAVAAAVLWLCPGAGEAFVPRRLAAWAALPGVMAYALFCGAPVAATRAAAMAGLTTLAWALGRPATAANGLGLAAAGLLWASPSVLGQVSFALSFCAVGALLLTDLRLVMPQRGGGRCTSIGRGLVQGLVASAAASWATAPITVYVFSQLAWVGVFTNLLAVPLGAYLATPTILVEALLANVKPAWQHLPTLMVAPLLALLDWLAATAVGAVGHGGGTLPFDGVALAAWVVISLAVLGGLRGGRVGRRLCPHLALVGGGLVLAAAARSGLRAASDGRLHVMHLAVGQGDSTLLLGPRGGAILVDGGGALTGRGFDPGRGVVLPALARLGIRRLDMMVVTHPHPDHIGGLGAVAAALPVGQLVHGGTGLQLASMQRLMASVRAGGGTIVAAAQLPAALAWRGAVLAFMHPRADTPQGDHLDLSFNDNSVVLRVDAGRRCVLLTGDIEAAAEVRLWPLWRPCDLMKVPHHGSRTSTLPTTLTALRPLAATILCGPDNLFGFPHAQTLGRLADAQVGVWRADQLGEIHLVGDLDGWRLGPGSRAGRP